MKNFGHPVYANIISQNDIDAYEQFYKAQTGVAIYKAFRTCTNGIKNYKEKVENMHLLMNSLDQCQIF